MEPFAEFVKELNHRGMTLKQIAEGVNTCITDREEHYSLTAVSWWARGKWIPRYSMLEHIYRHAPDQSWMRDLAMKGMAVKCPECNDKGILGEEANGKGPALGREQELCL